MSIKSVNPANGKLIRVYKEDTVRQAHQKVERTHLAWQKWKETSFSQRTKLMRNLAGLLVLRKKQLAELMALEMGKPLNAGMEELEKCASACHYYAANAKDFLKDQLIPTDAGKSYVSMQPLGVVLAVMPWNFPFWQLFRFLAPALMAGNCGVLKHASNVSGCALAIEKLVLEAGFPSDVFQVMLISSKKVSEIIKHPLIKAVTLTGSEKAGIEVARQAGELLKKTVLELGGSDAYLILDDADLGEAAKICAQSRLINNGQSCIAAKRFILVKSIQKKFIELFKAAMSDKITGYPLDPQTDLGPMAREDLRDELHRQVTDNIRAGAKCILGGFIPNFKGKHAFYIPTILTGITRQMPAYRQELFGPVALIITAKDTEEAINIANDSSFGLGAAVFTANVTLGEDIARNRIEAGSCFVNTFVKSDARLPFGGIKQSGYGRELGLFGLQEFVNIKTVYVR